MTRRALFFLGFLAFGAIGPARAARIPCTQSAFEQALLEACEGSDRVITFEPSCAGRIVAIAPGDRSRREIHCDGVVIDGEDLGIVFEMNPPWWQDGRHCDTDGDGVFSESCDSDGDGSPDACPEWEQGDWFLMVRGNGVVVRNIVVRNFYEGIHFDNDTHDNRVEGVVFENQGDDSFTNEPGAYRNQFVGNVVRQSCDKGTQLSGRADSGPGDYDVEILRNTFLHVKQPIRIPSSGRFRIEGNLIRGGFSGLYRCDGPRLDGPTGSVVWTANVLERCRRGLRVGGGTEIEVVESVFRENGLRGLYAYSDGSRAPVVLVEASRFESNGGGVSSEGGYGGIAVAGGAMLDAGGGSVILGGEIRSSAGGNVFLGNRGPSGEPLDLQNETGTTIKAELNYWGDEDPADQVVGAVDFQPWLTADPGGSGPPGPPARLRRTDRRD